MATSPPRNHWWHVTLYVSPRGLTTGPDSGALSKDLRGRKARWLIQAADHMADVVEADWQHWRTRVHGAGRHRS